MAEGTNNDILIRALKSAGIFYEKNLADENISPEIINLVPSTIVSQYHVIPIDEVNGQLRLVTDDPETLQNQNILANQLGRPIKILYGETINIRTGMDVYYKISNYSNVRSGTAAAGNDLATSPLQRKVEEVLRHGATIGASDIHMKPFANGIYVWMRTNGKLIDETDRFGFNAADGDIVANILKNKDQSSNSDSANKLMPNNGSFLLNHHGESIRCRIATTPAGSATELVQKLDVRLLPQSQNRILLENLYPNKEDLNTIKSILFKSSSGMFINAGPVGTGKTTALYADIDYLWNMAAEKKSVLHVFTIENPIEIKDDRFTQVQVRETSDPANSLTPLVALDAALRSDPDIILFGEIRNSAEAQAAMKASQTGLKMFTTIHAGSCTKTILRLLNLGADQLSMLSELRFILTQRLIPQLCPNCSQPHVLTENERAILSEEEKEMLTDSTSNLRERGSYEAQRTCTNPECSGGIIHRLAVPEYIVFNNDIRDALLHQNDFRTVDDVLQKHHFKSMWTKALRSVHNGHAELNDVIRLIGKE